MTYTCTRLGVQGYRCVGYRYRYRGTGVWGTGVWGTGVQVCEVQGYRCLVYGYIYIYTNHLFEPHIISL